MTTATTPTIASIIVSKVLDASDIISKKVAGEFCSITKTASDRGCRAKFNLDEVYSSELHEVYSTTAYYEKQIKV